MNSKDEVRWVWDETAGDDGRGDWLCLPALRTVAIQWTRHREDAEVEDVRWLLAHGHTLEQACARVGVSPGAIEKRLERTGG